MSKLDEEKNKYLNSDGSLKVSKSEMTQLAGDRYNTAAQNLAQVEANKPGKFNSKYTTKIDSTLGDLENTKPFSYDFGADPVYQQARDRYKAMGQSAMLDTMGQAAALTGGYGNSYAASAAQQAYQQNAGKVNDIIPELQAAAYQRYQNELANKKDMLGIYQGLDDTDYGRHRDDVVDFKDDRSYYSGQESDAVNLLYNSTNNDFNNSMDTAKFSYGMGRDAIEDERYEDETKYSRGITEQELALKKQEAYSGGSSGSGGRSSGSVPSSVINKTDDFVEENDPEGLMKYLGMQVELGTISPDQMDLIYNAYFDEPDDISNFTSKEAAVAYLKGQKAGGTLDYAGIMKENEWRRYKPGGYKTYSEYLESEVKRLMDGSK